jgi:hypothetical protein
LSKFERVIVGALIIIMAVVISLSTLDLAWLLIRDVITPPIVLLEVGELLDIFGFVLLIVIGVNRC